MKNILTNAIMVTTISFANVISIPQDYPTIQEGLNIAAEGDTVLVADGIYFENITWPVVNGIKLIGSGEENCIIDGDSLASVIRFEENLGGIIDTFTIIQSLTVRNGYAPGGNIANHGGGLYLNSASPYLKNMVITRNYAGGQGNGGGIFCFLSNPYLKDVIISENNIGENGGGMFCALSNPTLKNVSVVNNFSAEDGGGIACILSSPILINVEIMNNFCALGGGIYFKCSNPILTNVSIIENTAHYWGGGIYSVGSNITFFNLTLSENSAFGTDNSIGGGIFASSSKLSFMNSILWNNLPEEIYFDVNGTSNSTTIGYSNLLNGEEAIVINDNGILNWLEGNLDVNPLFVDTSNEDFSLQSNSPCIDAGIAFYEMVEEEYIDLNGNGAYDYGEFYSDDNQNGVWDNDEYLLDCNYNGVWDMAEPFTDTNENGVFDGGLYLDISIHEYSGSAPDMGAIEYGLDLAVNNAYKFPNSFIIHKNYPNPFNPVTTISYQLSNASFTNLSIYNIMGELIEILVNEYQSIGYQNIQWDASKVSSGIYFYKLTTGEQTFTKKMLLLK